MTAAHDYIEDARLRVLAAEDELSRAVTLFERGAVDWAHVKAARGKVGKARQAYHQARREAGKAARP